MDEKPDSNQELSIRGEIRRKLTHIAALALPLAAGVLGSRTVLMVLVPVTAIAFFSDWARVRSPRFKRLVERIFSPMMRKSELPALGDPLVVNGATWTVASFSILLIVFEAQIAITAFTVFMIGDAAAAIVGRNCGRHTWGRAGCTMEGSAAFLLFGMLTAVLIGGGGLLDAAFFAIPLLPLAAATLTACFAEMAPSPVNDNVLAPVAAAVILVLMLNILYDTPIELFPVF